MRVGRHRHLVSLTRKPQTTNDSDGFWEPLSPSETWARIQPFSPGADERTTTSLITIRHHPQVTCDTRLVWGSRAFFVRGVQEVDTDGAEMRLLCEEVTE